MMGGGHSAYSPKFGLGTFLFYFIPFMVIFHDMTIQASITSFSLPLSLPMDPSLPPTPSNTLICFGHYAVVAGAPTGS